MKISKLLAKSILIFLFAGFPLIGQQSDKNHLVILTILDSLSNVASNFQFEIMTPGKQLVQRGTTNSEGIYETELPKGQNYLVSFPSIEGGFIYNFRVPPDTRLKNYRVICRLPVIIVHDNKKKYQDTLGSSTRKIPVQIILQGKDQVKIPNLDFQLISSDKSLNIKAKSDANGTYRTDLTELTKYTIKTKVDGEDYADHFVVPKAAKTYIFRMILPMIGRIASGDVPTQSSTNKYLRTFSLQNITFETGSWELKTSSFPALDSLVSEMNSKIAMIIEIAGHTDDVGTEEDNMALSQKRAETIYEYLVDHGIEASRVTPIGYGESSPLASNATNEGRSLNRRIEVRVIKE
jgi:outer membrane protein OmpA-like peptidoglycan-associated protein